MNGLSNGLNVIMLPALETKVPEKGHSEPGMGSSRYSYQHYILKFGVSLTNLNRLLTLCGFSCRGGLPGCFSALWGCLGMSSSSSTSVGSSSSANELTRRCNSRACDPTSIKDTEDLKVDGWAQGTSATVVRNVVFKTPGSWIWLSGGLTHLCSYFQAWLWVYMNSKGLICHASFQKFPQMLQCPEMPQEYIR